MEMHKRVIAPFENKSSQDQKLKPQNPQSTQLRQQIIPSAPIAERCERHNELIKVGYDVEAGKLVCNKCLFENAKIKSESFNQQSAIFTPLITKELKKRYDQAFGTFKNRSQNITDIEPEKVKSLFRDKCLQFFNELRQQVLNCKQVVGERIKNSESLKELEDLMEKNQVLYQPNSSEGFDKVKEKFDGKISRNRFASITKHRQFYEEMITKIETSKDYMDELIANIQDLEGKVVQVQQEAQNEVQEQLSLIVEDSLMVDAEIGETVMEKQIINEIEVIDVDAGLDDVHLNIDLQ